MAVVQRLMLVHMAVLWQLFLSAWATLLLRLPSATTSPQTFANPVLEAIFLSSDLPTFTKLNDVLAKIFYNTDFSVLLLQTDKLPISEMQKNWGVTTLFSK